MDLFENLGFGRFDLSSFGLRLNFSGAFGPGTNEQLYRLTLLSFQHSIQDEHVEYIADIEDPRSLNLALNLFTLTAHETKHFHDLLITPYGSMLVRQYTHAAMLYLTCMTEMALTASRVILPLSSWVSDWELYQAIDPRITPPSDNIKDFVNEIERMQGLFRRSNAGSIRLEAPLDAIDATSIIEGLAILVQERAIANHFGQHRLTAFRAGFNTSSVWQRYYGAIEIVDHFLGESTSAELLSFLLFASLCGNFQDTDPSHLRYPKDVLFEMLLWIHTNSPESLRGPDLPKMMVAVNHYFEVKLGSGLQGMLTRASNANHEIRQYFTNIASMFDGVQGEMAQNLLKQFDNFSEIQTALSANLLRNPSWYFSASYLQEQRNLPKPVIYIDCESGIPVNADVEGLCHVELESRVELSGLPEDVRNDLTESMGSILEAYTPNGVLRIAHRLLPKYNFTGTVSASFGSDLSVEIPDLNVELWHRNFNAVIGGLRFAIEGIDCPETEAAKREFLFSLALVGVKLYSNGREIALPSLPDDWNSDWVGPRVRELLREPSAREDMEALRKRKHQM